VEQRISVFHLRSFSEKPFLFYLRDGELQSNNDFAHTSEEEEEVRDFIEMVLSDKRVPIS
jgi:hypothetical protein